MEEVGGVRKDVRGEIVEGVPHYWDHMASTEMVRLRDEIYDRASKETTAMWEM